MALECGILRLFSEPDRDGDPNGVDIDATLAFRNDICAFGYRCWCDMAQGRSMPDRLDVDPRKLGRYLSHLSLFNVDVTANGGAALVPRLLGSELHDVFSSVSPGGALADMLPPKIVCRWNSMGKALLDHGAPLRTSGRVAYQRRDWLRWEQLLAPLSDGGADVRLIYVFTVFESDD